MREISPISGMTVDEFFEASPPEAKAHIEKVRRQKQTGERESPSDTLIDRSKVLTSDQRKMLLNKVAELVDENCCGRAEMCQQFADLMHKSLTHLGITSRVVTGTSVYYDSKGQSVYRWPDDGHHWVSVGDEIIDGNVDSIPENPFAPNGLKVQPYWGQRAEAPRDRKFIPNPGARTPGADEDVENTWWPELKVWIDQSIKLT